MFCSGKYRRSCIFTGTDKFGLRFFLFCARIRSVNIIKITKENIEETAREIASVIKNNGVVILPFDTVYGYACDPKSEEALQKIFRLKNRDINKTIGLAASEIKNIQEISQLDINAEKYIKDHVPSKYTFIIKAKEDVDISKLCMKEGTVGVRIPDSKLVLDIIGSSSGIIAQTSANKSGLPDCYSIDELFTQYSKDELDQINMIINGGEIEKSGPSQIVNLTGNEPKEIERS